MGRLVWQAAHGPPVSPPPRALSRRSNAPPARQRTASRLLPRGLHGRLGAVRTCPRYRDIRDTRANRGRIQPVSLRGRRVNRYPRPAWSREQETDLAIGASLSAVRSLAPRLSDLGHRAARLTAPCIRDAR